MHETLKQLNTLVADIERLIQHIASEGGERAGESADKLRRTLRELRGGLTDLERQARREIGRRVKDAERYVRDHPLQTLGLTAAVAFVVGAILTRRE